MFSHVVKLLSTGAVLIGFALLCSCATATSDVYIPTQLGRVEKDHNNAMARLVIFPDKNQFNKGDPIDFTVRLKNISSTPYWVPKKISPTFVWSFKDGRRDGQLPESGAHRSFSREEVKLLKPGEEISVTRTVKTNYFLHEGLVEFEAILNIPDNANPELQPFLSSKLHSNGYGLMVSDTRGWKGDRDPSSGNLDF